MSLDEPVELPRQRTLQERFNDVAQLILSEMMKAADTIEGQFSDVGERLAPRRKKPDAD
ncbi:MAG: hypothetical protein AB7S38_19885 [Vulcanimicrobiota bacterium]